MREGCNIKQLLSDLRGIMIYREMNCRTLGEKVHKDAATVARQLDPERSNPTAAVLIEYAEAMDATIVAMTREAAQAMDLHVPQFARFTQGYARADGIHR